MEQEVTVKNTKSEILKAYEELLAKVQAQKSDQPKQLQEVSRKMEVIDKASKNTTEGIISAISSLKLGLAKELDKLNEQLLAEYKKLEDIQTAINLEKKNLEELYEVSANADSLAAMLLAQKERKPGLRQRWRCRKPNLKRRCSMKRLLSTNKCRTKKHNSKLP